MTTVFGFLSWNQKNLDYEIETVEYCYHLQVWPCAWNQKNLDYEIETCKCHQGSASLPSSLKSKEPRLRDWNGCAVCWCFGIGNLEIKRTSITRLKRDYDTRDAQPRSVSWNQKNLDYEIETIVKYVDRCFVVTLEIKRTSITRLKLRSKSSSRLWSIATWNQKNLDYEIETR